MNRMICTAIVTIAALASGPAAAKDSNSWRIDTTDEWNGAARQIEGLAVNEDLLAPTGNEGVYRSNLQRFKKKHSAQTLTLTASTKWENWEPT
ncbi:MAG: hypothetical protein HN341_12610, partial [Verrucomicrobia bacterium]|nr:hypothetical protein [Verrucomicrobiota bacterium]